ncbi:MAG: hypothetical protein WC975_13490 [Phycisphaerae bacterium]
MPIEKNSKKNNPKNGSLEPLRRERPRLYHAMDDSAYRFPAPTDPVRKQILTNILTSCEELAAKEPADRILYCPDSPHPFHQLYITFIAGVEAGALIEQYSFAWRMTGNRRWLERARCWLCAASAWEHSDRVEEYFYTANRYMQAFAVALDWLAGALTKEEEQWIEACLVQLLERWWPVINTGRHSPEGSHHTVVDYGHFGVAALQLLGRHPHAEEWVQAVVDRFRAGIMPNGCNEDGSPVDRLGFEGNENAWMLQFCDALRNVTGIDLYREFPERLSRPLLFMRYHLVPPAEIPPRRYTTGYTNMLNNDGATQMDDLSPVLLRLAQEAGDKELCDIALRDPRMGHFHHAGYGVKNSKDESVFAEAFIARGPYAYLWYNPDFAPHSRKDAMPLSRKFSFRYGESVVCRSGWESRSLVVQVASYGGVSGANAFSNLHVQWAGYPVLTCIGAFESIPVFCGNLPSVGGQNENVALVREFVQERDADTVVMESPRTWHEYRFLRGQTPALLVTVQRKSRGVRIVKENGEMLARTDGQDYLQYPREPHFNPEAGELRLRVRLHSPVDNTRRQILFHTGTSLRDCGTNVNSFFLGFMGDAKGLTFEVKSQRFLTVAVNIPADVAAVTPGKWHEITARWGGFNTPDADPFIEIEMDGQRRWFNDPGTFGEVGKDTVGMERQRPRTFYIQPNTVLAFGAPVQLRDCGTAVDISDIRLNCPGRQPLHVDFSAGLAGETGSGFLVYKLNPTALLELEENGALLGAGPEKVRVLSVLSDAEFRREIVPYFPPALPAGSLKYFYGDGFESDATRLVASCGTSDRLVFLFAPATADCRFENTDNGFELYLNGTRRAFTFDDQGGRVLQR